MTENEKNEAIDKTLELTTAERLQKLITWENFIMDVMERSDVAPSALRLMRELLDGYRECAMAHGSLMTIEHMQRQKLWIEKG